MYNRYLKEILNLYNREGRVYIFEYDESQTHHSCTYEVVSEGVSAEKEALQGIPISQSRWWSEQILAGKPIILNTLEQLPEKQSMNTRYLQLKEFDL